MSRPPNASRSAESWLPLMAYTCGPQTREPHQEVIQQGHRLGRGHRFVIDIPGEEHSVGGFLPDDVQKLIQNIPLVLQHGKLVYPPTQMQVGEMDKFHAAPLSGMATVKTIPTQRIWEPQVSFLHFSLPDYIEKRRSAQQSHP